MDGDPTLVINRNSFIYKKWKKTWNHSYFLNGVMSMKIMKMNKKKAYLYLNLNMKHKNQKKTQETKDKKMKCANKYL
jgi:hypothetical protein